MTRTVSLTVPLAVGTVVDVRVVGGVDAAVLPGVGLGVSDTVVDPDAASVLPPPR